MYKTIKKSTNKKSPNLGLFLFVLIDHFFFHKNDKVTKKYKPYLSIQTNTAWHSVGTK